MLQIAKAPLYYVRSGTVYYNYLNTVGNGGDVWSSQAGADNSTSARSYNLILVADTVLPSYQHFRYVGLSLRCLAD